MAASSSSPRALVRRAAAWSLGLAVGAALCAATPAAPAAEGQSLMVDFAAGHPWFGLGAQVWLQPPQPAAARMLHDMNARFARISLVPNQLPVDRLQPGMPVERILPLLDELAAGPHRERLAEYRDLAHQQQLRTHLVFWHPPEEWLDARAHKAASHGESHLARSDRLADWARLSTACMVWLERFGIPLDAVELTNEPQGAWDARFTPEQYAELVVDARREMDAAGLRHVRIEGPGTGVRNAGAYLAALQARHALPALGYVTAHAYQPVEQMADGTAPGYDDFLGHGAYGPIIVTEFGVKKHNGDDPQAAQDLDLESPRYAVTAAAEGLVLLGRGASSAFYWQLQDRPSSKKAHGLLDPAGRRRPVAEAIATLFGHVPAGGTLAAATGGSSRVPVEGVLVDGKVHLLMANLTDAPQRVTVRFTGPLPPRHAVGGQDGFSEQGGPGRQLPDAGVQDGVFHGTLPPRAVASVLLQ